MLNDDQNPLEYEILAEKAASLFRNTKKMLAALQALRAFDEQFVEVKAFNASLALQRKVLLVDAAELAWFVIVQRELLRFPTDDEVYREFRITDEVRRHMGPREIPRE
jgi:hypothetical protein